MNRRVYLMTLALALAACGRSTEPTDAQAAAAIQDVYALRWAHDGGRAHLVHVRGVHIERCAPDTTAPGVWQCSLTYSKDQRPERGAWALRSVGPRWVAAEL